MKIYPVSIFENKIKKSVRQPPHENISLLKALISGVAQAQTIEEAFTAVLRTVCQRPDLSPEKDTNHCPEKDLGQDLGQCLDQGPSWQYAEVWCADPKTNQLHKRQTWSTMHPAHGCSVGASDEIDCFTQPGNFSLLATSEATFPIIETSLLRRIWRCQQAEWYADINRAAEAVVQQSPSSIACEIKALLGVPLVVEGATLAILVFFSREMIAADPSVIDSIDAIAGLIAQLAAQQRSQAELKNSEARFQAFMANSPAMVFMKDEAGQYVYSNRPLERTFDLAAGTLLGKTDADYLHRQAAQKVQESDHRVVLNNLSNKEEILVEKVPFLSSGDRYWQVLKFSFKDYTEQTLIGGFALDVTEQKQTEKNLAEEREITQATLKSIGDAVITTNLSGRLQYLNPVAEQLTGWTQQEAYNQPVAKIFRMIHQATRQVIQDPVEEALTKRQTIRLETHVMLMTRGGRALLIETSVAPIETDDGRLIGAVIVFHDVSKTQRLTQALSWQVSHDALTGLLNRQEFELRLRQAVDNARSHNKVHALCYLDLDNFKIINDTCGHTAGDQLLKQVSTLLMSHIRTTDTLARLGGDEFGLLLEYCHLEHAKRIVHKLREKLSALRFVCGGRAFSVGISIGVTMITTKTNSVETVLSDADAACYVAKRKGRNRTHFHSVNDVDLAQQRGEIQWAAYIAEALETEKFQLYQQPILPLSLAAPQGEHYEVLLRLQDQSGQLVSPGAFMPAAERYDLMPLIDRWVVNKLFSTQASYYQQVWQRSQTQPNLGSHLYSVNLSGASINDDDFMPFLKEQFERYAIPPSLICFEITETATIANLQKAAQFITEIRALGCQFALDDFGSGMSSFAYLKSLPVDYLKIDGNFIQNIVKNEIDTAMVTAIHQIAQVMNIQTVAEFVEDEITLETVRDLGISFAQGYAVARPAPLLH